MKVILLIIATLFALRFLNMIADVLVLIATAFFLAIALNPAVSWISRRLRKGNRVLATGIAYLIVIAFLIAFFSLVIPPLVRQTVDFVSEIPATLRELTVQDSAVGNFVRRYDLEDQVNNLSRDVASRLPEMRGQLFNTATRIGSALISIVTVLVLTFMMLVEGPGWLKRIWELHPEENRERNRKLVRKMYLAVTAYVNGQLLIALIGAFFALVALFIASSVYNVSVNAVALAGIVALTGLIPMFGNTLGAAIVVLACLFVSVPLAITMAIFFLVYQQIENVTIQPIIQSRKSELTPLLVFIAALVGINFGGILGAFVAIPAASCIKILLEDRYNQLSSSKA